MVPLVVSFLSAGCRYGEQSIDSALGNWHRRRGGVLVFVSKLVLLPSKVCVMLLDYRLLHNKAFVVQGAE